MKMTDLPLSPCAVSATGIESGDYFAIDHLGHAMIYRCRTYAHGVVFDDREEPKPFRTTECFAILTDADINVLKLQHQCTIDRNKALGIKGNTESYETKVSKELESKYSKKKKN